MTLFPVETISFNTILYFCFPKDASSNVLTQLEAINANVFRVSASTRTISVLILMSAKW